MRRFNMINITARLGWLLLLGLICGDSALAQDTAQTVASYPADAEIINHHGFWSVVPPLLAIVLALLLKRVIPALFLGIWLGAWLIAGKSLGGLWQGLLDSFQVYVLNAMANRDHTAIILFSMMVGGMVGIISANGGMQGVVGRVIGWASDAKRAAITTWCMGLAIFFDDYANTLVVGNSMRPLSDKMRLSREKLAYIVDSTAAPVSCIALITTWIGYEVGLIQGATDKLPGFDQQAYWVFLNTIPYSFYPLLALLFVLLICTLSRDFGPMYKAEKRARETGVVLSESNGSEGGEETELEMSDSVEHPRARNAILPILGLVITVLYGLWTTGQPDDPNAEINLREVIGNADSYQALMWGSLVGVLIAALLSMGQRILDMEQTVQAWFKGVRSMLFAMIILVLAWSLGNITEVLGTANYLVEIIGDTLPVGLLPALVFIIAACTAFATGSSWGAMGILLPLVVPLAWAMLNIQEPGATAGADMHIMYAAIASVLGGAVWGDHCSPISDTTILSSMASQCDHIEHVRTQLPYAMVTGLTAILICLIPSGLGLSWWLSLLLGSGVLLGVLLFIGKPVANYRPQQDNSQTG